MRHSYLALLLLACVSTGCFWQRRPPYANAPVLLHYKPTLSDSATILAENQVRRGPTRPPMPTIVREEDAEHNPLPKIVEPASAQEPPPLPPPSIPVTPEPAGPMIRAAADAPSWQAPTAEKSAHRTVVGDYGHDADYRWIQGVLERSHRGYCCVRYCDPSTEDALGGKVRLR